MDGQLLRDGERWALRYEREFPCNVARLWRAVTEADELARWFPGRPRIELEVGGHAHYEDPEDFDFEIDPDLLHRTGAVQEIDPPKLFVITWGEDLLRFELHPEGEQSRLIFTYTFENRAAAIRSGSGWSVCLDMLGASLGSGEQIEDRWLAYVAAYTEELGSAGTYTRHGDDEATLRFERVLSHPAADVWQALIDPELARHVACGGQLRGGCGRGRGASSCKPEGVHGAGSCHAPGAPDGARVQLDDGRSTRWHRQVAADRRRRDLPPAAHPHPPRPVGRRRDPGVLAHPSRPTTQHAAGVANCSLLEGAERRAARGLRSGGRLLTARPGTR